MKLHNIWSYGQLFGYSAIDGKNRYFRDFIGTLTRRKIEIRFELDEWVKVYFPVKGRVKFSAITGDMIDAKTESGDFFITFLNNDTLVGYSPVKPQIIGQKKLDYKLSRGVDIYFNDKDAFGVLLKEENGLYRFCIHHSFCYSEARSGANEFISCDIDSLKGERYAYYEKMPKCKNKRFERMYYKALSVHKVNVRSAEGNIPCTWTTPDRVPHRHMWLWDSVFHALAMVHYNPEIAKSAIRAVLSQIRPDGFIPHMMNPVDFSDVTQPQVLAFGVWEVYKKTQDKAFLSESVDALERYLEWDMKNRDKNGNGLLEWLTEPDYVECKCGESGQDDSPRFDFDVEMDAVDFSTFACNDARYLSYIFNELGDVERSEKWSAVSNSLKDRINALLWDDKDGVYYDRLFSGEFSKILTPSSFFPLLAGIPSKERAEKMVKALTDENGIWTKNSLSTVAKSHPTYSNGMWRGGVWLNLNYFVIMGLKKYGYGELAEELKNKTLSMVERWYKKTGAIFEFYDPEDIVPPYLCQRKQECKNPPDWRKQVHSIIDFNWSACFTMLLIQDVIY